MIRFQINEKNKAIYDEALKPQKFNDCNDCAPCGCDCTDCGDCDGPAIECDCEDCCCGEPVVETQDENGNWVKAEPINNDPDILKFGALNDVITKGAIETRDYVCWSDGAYSKKNNVFETNDGQMLKAYDVVLILDGFGYPMAFGMFTGQYNVDTVMNYVKPVFMVMGEEDFREYSPKCIDLDIKKYL